MNRQPGLRMRSCPTLLLAALTLAVSAFAHAEGVNADCGNTESAKRTVEAIFQELEQTASERALRDKSLDNELHSLIAQNVASGKWPKDADTSFYFGMELDPEFMKLREAGQKYRRAYQRQRKAAIAYQESQDFANACSRARELPDVLKKFHVVREQQYQMFLARVKAGTFPKTPDLSDTTAADALLKSLLGEK